PPAGTVPPEVRAAHPPDPAPGREGVRLPPANLAGPSPGPGRRPQAGRVDGAGNAAILRDGHSPSDGRGRPPAAGRPGRGGTQALAAGRGAGTRAAILRGPRKRG